MTKIKLLLLAFAALLLVPLTAEAKTTFISKSYAKQLIVKKVAMEPDAPNHPYKASLLGRPSKATPFLSEVRWQGNHIMLAYRDYIGTINMIKSKKAPKGLARVIIAANPVIEPFGPPR